MKTTKFTLSLLALTLLSCTNDEPKDYDDNVGSKNTTFVTKEKAIEIATDFMGITRSEFNLDTDVILSNGQDYSSIDTLAYLLNIRDNGGFVIVSADSHMEPILAFSDEENLSISDFATNPVYDVFISNLKEYKDAVYEEDIEDSLNSSESSLLSNSVQPMLQKGYWKQTAPFNKYVNIFHPGSPVGCVALATTQIMMNCRDSIFYHGANFNCKAILKAIADSIVTGNVQPPIVRPPSFGDNIEIIPMTYEQGTDRAAIFLYHMAEDLPSNFGTVTTASSSNAVRMFKELDFISPVTTLQPYNTAYMVHYLNEHHFLYVDTRISRILTFEGEETFYPDGVGVAGHAFIIDGCRITSVPSVTGQLKRAYFHIDWGDGGRGNGYYLSAGLWTIRRGLSEMDANTSSMKYYPVLKTNL